MHHYLCCINPSYCLLIAFLLVSCSVSVVSWSYVFPLLWWNWYQFPWILLRLWPISFEYGVLSLTQFHRFLLVCFGSHAAPCLFICLGNFKGIKFMNQIAIFCLEFTCLLLEQFLQFYMGLCVFYFGAKPGGAQDSPYPTALLGRVSPGSVGGTV